MQQQVDQINAELHRLVPPENTPPETIHKAMRYSLFAGGKRIRPLLALAASHAIRPDCPGILPAACSLELIHTYSLIHDDLPALDNDDLRRGRPTCHKVFGEAMAILAGDALLTAAFQVLAALTCDDATKVRLIAELSSASGTVGGMIGGQVHDLEGEGQKPDPALLERIHRAKTGALLRASVRIGAIYAGATPDQLSALSEYGAHLGLAFQIVDDILDVEQTAQQLGKTPGKDAAQQKITFPAVYGLEKSKAMAATELSQALSALAPFQEQSTPLRTLATLIRGQAT